MAKPEAARASAAKGFVLDFVKRRGFYFLLSALILVPGLLSLAIPPSLKPGIEFSSGATFTVHFEDANVTQGAVGDKLAELGHEEARVQRTSDGSYIVRLKDIEGPSGPPVGPAPPGPIDEIRDGLVESFGPIGKLDEAGAFTETDGFTNFSSVSEIVSKEIGRNAAIAVGAAALAILVYISWTFRNVPNPWRYGVAAIVAALHDAVFILGAFSIFGKLFDTEINTMFITGVLTVIGFSVQIRSLLDRIRENVGDTRCALRRGGERQSDRDRCEVNQHLVYCADHCDLAPVNGRRGYRCPANRVAAGDRCRDLQLDLHREPDTGVVGRRGLRAPVAEGCAAAAGACGGGGIADYIED